MKSKIPLHEKSSLEQIKQRFDGDVERFSKLETGQQSAIDAVLILDLVANCAATQLAQGSKLLDIGCGAGNFTLRILGETPSLDCTLVDLSLPMLEKARERVAQSTSGEVEIIQSDMRELNFEPETFDCIVAGQVMHHLREDADWLKMYSKLHSWLKPNGTIFIADLITFDDSAMQTILQIKYEEHLVGVGGEEYRDKVLAYIEVEDSPRSLKFQMDILRQTGFSDYDVLHRNSLFGAYFARK